MASIGDRYALIEIWAFYTAPPEVRVSSTLTGDYNLHRPKARKELAMTNYIITNPNSKYGYDFVRFDDNDNIVERKEITSKTTDGYLHLPVEINGRKLISLKQLENAGDKFCLDTLPLKAPRITTGITKSPKAKVNLDEYLTDEEKSEIEKHKKAIDNIYAAVNERAKKDIQMAELKAMLAAFTPEEIARLMGKA